MKKVVFIVLVLVLMLAISIPAFASFEGCPEIPVDNIKYIYISPPGAGADRNGDGVACYAGTSTFKYAVFDNAIP